MQILLFFFFINISITNNFGSDNNKQTKNNLEIIEKLMHYDQQAEEYKTKKKLTAEQAFILQAQPVVQNTIEEITKLKIEPHEYNNDIDVCLNQIYKCFQYKNITQSNSWLAGNAINDSAKIIYYFVNVDIKIFAYINKLHFIVMKQRNIEDAKKEFPRYAQTNFIDPTITKFEEEYIKKINAIKEYIGITDADGVSIKNYIKEEIQKIQIDIEKKEKNLENLSKKTILSLFKISLCIILGAFIYKAYDRIRKTKICNIIKKRYKSVFHCITKNAWNIIDILIIISSSIFIIDTAKYLDKI